MRAPHHLHGVLDVTPLLGFIGLALALASQGIAGRLGDRLEAVLLDHLPGDGVNLHLGYHVALPSRSATRSRRNSSRRAAAAAFKPLNRRSRSTCRRTQFVSLARASDDQPRRAV